MSQFCFKVIWLKDCVGICVDKKLKSNYNLPVTSFFFWPRIDGWKLLNNQLNLKPWLTEEEKITILNGYTEILYFWKDNFNKRKFTNFKKFETKLNFTLIAIE